MQEIKHAYKQAPWRNQLRGLAWILLFLVIFILVAIANLNVSAKTYAAGIEIQRMNSEKDRINHNIADLKNELGEITSYEVMVERAIEQGYQTVSDPSRTLYLTIPGYQPPAVSLEIPAVTESSAASLLEPVYTQSLWDLFMESALKLSKKTKGAY